MASQCRDRALFPMSYLSRIREHAEHRLLCSRAVFVRRLRMNERTQPEPREQGARQLNCMPGSCAAGAPLIRTRWRGWGTSRGPVESHHRHTRSGFSEVSKSQMIVAVELEVPKSLRSLGYPVATEGLRKATGTANDNKRGLVMEVIM